MDTDRIEVLRWGWAFLQKSQSHEARGLKSEHFGHLCNSTKREAFPVCTTFHPSTGIPRTIIRHVRFKNRSQEALCAEHKIDVLYLNSSQVGANSVWRLGRLDDQVLRRNMMRSPDYKGWKQSKALTSLELFRFQLYTLMERDDSKACRISRSIRYFGSNVVFGVKSACVASWST